MLVQITNQEAGNAAEDNLPSLFFSQIHQTSLNTESGEPLCEAEITVADAIIADSQIVRADGTFGIRLSPADELCLPVPAEADEIFYSVLDAALQLARQSVSCYTELLSFAPTNGEFRFLIPGLSEKLYTYILENTPLQETDDYTEESENPISILFDAFILELGSPGVQWGYAKPFINLLPNDVLTITVTPSNRDLIKPVHIAALRLADRHNSTVPPGQERAEYLDEGPILRFKIPGLLKSYLTYLDENDIPDPSGADYENFLL